MLEVISPKITAKNSTAQTKAVSVDVFKPQNPLKLRYLFVFLTVWLTKSCYAYVWDSQM